MISKRNLKFVGGMLVGIPALVALEVAKAGRNALDRLVPSTPDLNHTVLQALLDTPEVLAEWDEELRAAIFTAMRHRAPGSLGDYEVQFDEDMDIDLTLYGDVWLTCMTPEEAIRVGLALCCLGAHGARRGGLQ